MEGKAFSLRIFIITRVTNVMEGRKERIIRKSIIA